MIFSNKKLETDKKHQFTIVGGGTAGLIAALILRKRLHCDVKIIKSEKIGIIGVGEGSTEHWDEFMKVIDIHYIDLIKEAECTVKLGVYFDGWTEKPYFHNVTNFYQIQTGQQLSGISSMYVKNKPQIEITDSHVLENLVENVIERSPTRQYHFNTFKLNNFLLKICRERGIVICEDEIIDVKVNERGITEIQGQKSNYYSDFWIDSTGFSKILISKLNAEWQSYEKYLKLNRAIAFQTEDTDEYAPYTLAKAMKYGWLWRIPVQGRWGNGYIFDNQYIGIEEAKLEVEKIYGHNITIGKDIKFNPGALKESWIKNCMAVGLSSNFVEPLEATSIGTAINQIFLFLHYWIPNYNDKDIKEFNYKMDCIMNNVRDFVCLHYLVKREDTKFWQDLKTTPIPNTLKINLEKWSRRLPISEDFSETGFTLFKEHNFASVLYGIGFYNKKQVEMELNKFSQEMRLDIDRAVKNYLFYYKNNKKNYVSHKEWIYNIVNK
jgi:tryptophan 7-halogenase